MSDETAPTTPPPPAPGAPAAHAVDGVSAEKRTGQGARIAGISAATAMLFLALRLLAVAQWNWHTAFEVAGTIDVGNAVPVVFGMLFAEPVFTGILLLILLPVVVVSLFWPERRRSSVFSHLLMLAALVAGTVALTSSRREWWVPIGAFVLLVVFAIARILMRRGAPAEVISWILRRIGVIALVGLLILAAIVTDPWMPREQIRTTHGTVDGYVLDVEPGFLQVLETSDHEVRTIVSSTVLSRTVVW